MENNNKSTPNALDDGKNNNNIDEQLEKEEDRLDDVNNKDLNNQIGIKVPSFEDTSSFYPFQRVTSSNVNIESSSSSSKIDLILRILLRTICLIFLFPIRFIMLVLCLLLSYIISKIALIGLSSNQSPLERLSTWRAMLVMSLRPIIRILLFSLGFIWINESNVSSWDDMQTLYNIPSDTIISQQKQQYKISSSTNKNTDKAYVIIANHLGYVDILLLMFKYGGAFVAKESIKNTPIVGVVSRALQTLFVSQNKSLTDLLLERVNKTYDCHDSIYNDNMEHKYADAEEYYHTSKEICGTCLSNLVIFPEGTTTNGKSMVKFRTGIFLAKKRLQPITIELSTSSTQHFNLSWESIYFSHHLFYTMTQLYNKANIIKLPIYNPTNVETNDVHLFSSNVQLLFSYVLKQDIYLLNRKHKILYHKYLLGIIDEKELLRLGKEEFENDSTLVRMVTAA